MERRNFLGGGLMAGLALTGIAFSGAKSATRAAAGADLASANLAGVSPVSAVRAGVAPAGTDFAGSGEAGPGSAVIREPGLPTWPLFEWQQPGCVLKSGRAVFQPPPLAVYGDDTAYADAATSLTIPPIWVSTLRDHALDVLGTPADLVRVPPTGDPPDDQVRVRTDAGDYLTARLSGWQDGDPEHAYPPQIRELYQHAMGIRRHVLAAGRPWRPTGVLLAVVTLNHRPDHFRPWPRRLPMPDDALYQEIRLPGGPAGLPRTYGKGWPCYQLTPDRFAAATWRPLLPHEIT